MPCSRQADTAMYRAKRTGRNRFCWATRRSGADILSLQPLAWSAAHAIGIQDIDDQHSAPGEHIDRLSAALVDALDSDAILARLNDLVSYAEFHFADRRADDGATPDRRISRDTARSIAACCYDIQNLHVVGDLGSISLILRYLQEWLLRHVDGADRQLGQMLIALGCR